MKEIIVERVIDGKKYQLRTGKIAKQADGAVWAQLGDTVVFVTACASRTPKQFMDFFPLTVDFREKAYAAGKIPGGFFKREAKPSTNEVLNARVIDRPIRPLFDDGFKAETQIMASVLSYDHENPFDVLGVSAASAALYISDIPFSTPVSIVKVVKHNGQFMVNPSVKILEDCELHIDIAGTKDGITMVEGESKEVSEEDMVKALEIGHSYIKQLIEMQEELREKVGVPKREITKVEPLSQELIDSLKEKIVPAIEKTFDIKEKLEKQEARNAIFDEFLSPIIENEEEDKERIEYLIKNFWEDVQKEVTRSRIINQGIREDDRKLNEIRKITCEVDLLPRAHGSALFTRGQTQSLGVATLGTSRDQPIIDGLNEEEYKKRFFLHYNFPPFSVGEVRRAGFVSRRELGHGNLAERGLKQVIPEELDFPYTIRVVSDVMESNGSSSMATVCSGSLSMMAAGVPLKKQVAGIAMGLIEDGDDYYVLSDILGSEDHFGDMDFKVIGTEDGICAFQMDIKIKSLPLEVMAKAMTQAKEGRLHILGIMNDTISSGREDLSEYAPRIQMITIDPDKIRDVIGSGGKVIRKMIEDFDVDIDIDSSGSGEIRVFSLNAENGEKAIKAINDIVREIEVGEIFEDAEVVRITDFGAFVKLTANKDGLLHISQIDKQRVNKVEDFLTVGDKVKVKVLKVDDQGRVSLSRKALL